MTFYQRKLQQNKMQHYEVLSMIGQGAYGVVLKARRKDTNKIVAIKKFKETDEEELIYKTSMREINVLKNIKHQNIVELQQAFKNKGIFYLVFEYVDRNLLEELQQSGGALSSKLIAKYMYQLLKGLSYMHQNQYIHRDIKPQNLLISSDRKLKICDMGFARKVDKQSQKLTDYVATRWYRSPQLLTGSKYDSAVDIWATGCIMGELIDGKPLFPGQNEIDQLALIKKCLGPLDIEQKLGCTVRASRKTQVNDIAARYKSLISSHGLNLLQKMLTLDPKKRITAKQALKHRYFEQTIFEERIYKPQLLQTDRLASFRIDPIIRKRKTVKFPESFRTEYTKQKQYVSKSPNFSKIDQSNLIRLRKKIPQEKDKINDISNGSRLFMKARINENQTKKGQTLGIYSREKDLVFMTRKFYKKYSKG